MSFPFLLLYRKNLNKICYHGTFWEVILLYPSHSSHDLIYYTACNTITFLVTSWTRYFRFFPAIAIKSELFAIVLVTNLMNCCTKTLFPMFGHVFWSTRRDGY